MLLPFLLLLILPISLSAYGIGCGGGLPPPLGLPGPPLGGPLFPRSPCGTTQYMQQPYQGYQSYQQVQQQPIQPIQPQQYYYPTSSMMQNTYVQPQPAQLPQATVIDKDLLTTAAPELIKSSEYDKFEDKLAQLKQATTNDPYEPPINISTTYIRELPVPQPYLPRPLPYRPHPMIPSGCPVLPPQYLRPMPYMPRGYVQPLPYVTPPPMPIPQPVPPPQIHPPPQPYYSVAPTPMPLFPMPNNDCCGRCNSPCRLQQRQHAKAQASKTWEEHSVPKREAADSKKDGKCTSEELKELMIKSTTNTTAITKRIIQKTAEEKFGNYFSVFCSREDFSYVARSEVFCQTEKNGIFCYAFQHK